MTWHGPSILGPLLLAATLLAPALLLLLSVGRRTRALVPTLLAAAPLPALITAFACPPDAAIVFDEGRLNVTLAVGRPGALLLGVTALLWILAGAYTTWAQAGDPRRQRFAVAWLLCLLGCMGVFIAADLASFYLLFAIVSLSAFGLVVHDGTPKARRAAMVYVVLAILGEACLLVGFVLLAIAVPGDSLRIDDAVAALPDFRLRSQTLVFLLLGMGLKAGLLPLHGWLPVAHPAAPAPGSAVLSGAIIKTGIIGLVAFMPMGPAEGDWCANAGTALLTIGMATALYTVLVGLTQRNPKTVLAYSSASQMGVTAAVLGAGMMLARDAAAGSADNARMAATFYAAHHVLVKGALFLGVGLLAAQATRWRSPILILMALLGLSFAGLPGTGGSLAKLATKPFFDHGWPKLLSLCSTIGSAMLMTHFMARLAEQAPPAPDAATSPGRASPPPRPGGTLSRSPLRSPLLTAWLACAVAAFLMPWLLCRAATGIDPMEALGATEMWSALWPVLVGAAAAIALHASRVALPAIPEGDFLVPAEALAQRALAGSGFVETLECTLGRWWVAGVLLVGIGLALAVATM